MKPKLSNGVYVVSITHIFSSVMNVEVTGEIIFGHLKKSIFSKNVDIFGVGNFCLDGHSEGSCHGKKGRMKILRVSGERLEVGGVSIFAPFPARTLARIWCLGSNGAAVLICLFFCEAQRWRATARATPHFSKYYLFIEFCQA